MMGVSPSFTGAVDDYLVRIEIRSHGAKPGREDRLRDLDRGDQRRPA
jgi:hypothetical protein